MENYRDILSNNSIWCGLFAWFVSQCFKYVTNGIKNRQWNISHLFCSGGMPSSHTAATIALTTMVGFLDGFDSTLFAVCLIFSIVVMYDAAGVRRQAGKQGSIINMLLNFDLFKDPSMKFTEIKEKIGHSPFEVVMGAITGVLCAMLFQAI